MRFLVLALAVVGLGCRDVAGPEVGEEFELQAGHGVLLEDARLWVAFLGVAEDSRCPAQVMCVWVGDASVLVETAPYPDVIVAKTDTLHTNLDPRSLARGGVELVLIGLEPYPALPGSIEPGSYVARFRAEAR